MKILAIETSCDETGAAVTEEQKVLSSAIYSQVLLHKKWGGVVPSLAKRAHEERIDLIIEEAVKKSNTKIEEINAIAVTYGPGLAIALEVGISKAKDLAKKYKKKLIAVNHMAGHIYACFAQNSHGNPAREFTFPYLALLISGAHTELVLFKEHNTFEVLGETIDDAAGEAIDKAARMLGFGYPGGQILERLAAEVKNEDRYEFPRPMLRSENLDFSFSGLKTHFLYFLRKMTDEEIAKNLKYLASSFQEAVFDTLLFKTEKGMKETKINRLVVGGGVSANQYLRKKLRILTTKYKGEVIFPPQKYLSTDNAAMIGVAAYYQAQIGEFVRNPEKLDRIPRLRLGDK